MVKIRMKENKIKNEITPIALIQTLLFALKFNNFNVLRWATLLLR